MNKTIPPSSTKDRQANPIHIILYAEFDLPYDLKTKLTKRGLFQVPNMQNIHFAKITFDTNSKTMLVASHHSDFNNTVSDIN